MKNLEETYQKLCLGNTIEITIQDFKILGNFIELKSEKLYYRHISSSKENDLSTDNELIDVPLSEIKDLKLILK